MGAVIKKLEQNRTVSVRTLFSSIITSNINSTGNYENRAFLKAGKIGITR